MRVRGVICGVIGLLALASSACHERKSSPETRQRAQKIWRERCSDCHGASGRGDGPRAASLRARPRDFGDRAWQDSEEDDELAEVIVEGGAAEGYSTEMPANPDLAGEPEVVAALVELVRSFRK